MFENYLAQAYQQYAAGQGQAQQNNPYALERMLLLQQYGQLDKALSMGAGYGNGYGASLPGLASGFKAPTPPLGPYIHGTNGLLNMPGLDPRIFGAMMYPDTTALGRIPVVQRGAGLVTEDYGGLETVLMGIMTGVTQGALDDPLNQPTGDCVEGPQPGLTKLGAVVNTYGRYRGSTRPVSIVQAGMARNIADPMTLRLMNGPNFGNAFMPTLPGSTQIFMNELAMRLFELVTSFQRMFQRQIWTGNPALNSGQRKFIWGLTSQVNTSTHRDAFSSAVLTAADPVVFNFGYNNVKGTTGNIMQVLEEADAHVQYHARRHRLNPFSYTLYMRPELFREITAVVPVNAYYDALAQINQFTNGRVVVDARDATDYRDRLRRDMVLPLNGRFVSVVEDDGIQEFDPTTAAQLTIAGTYSSDIFAIPDTVLGGIPALYFDYFDHNNNNSQAIGQLAGVVRTFTSDNGLFRWYISFDNGCLLLTFDMVCRLNMIASQLAFRVLNVAYQPAQHFRTSQPDTAYFADGGVTQQTTNVNLYTGWNGATLTNTGW